MDSDRRTALAERRRFMRQRNAARSLRAEIEPAWSALEAAGEEFRVHALGSEPPWCPGWVPSGYSQIPWDLLEGVHHSASGLGRADLAAVASELLAVRLRPSDPVLFVPDGKRWSLGLRRAAFDRHREARRGTAPTSPRRPRSGWWPSRATSLSQRTDKGPAFHGRPGVDRTDAGDAAGHE